MFVLSGFRALKKKFFGTLEKNRKTYFFWENLIKKEKGIDRTFFKVWFQI